MLKSVYSALLYYGRGFKEIILNVQNNCVQIFKPKLYGIGTWTDENVLFGHKNSTRSSPDLHETD